MRNCLILVGLVMLSACETIPPMTPEERAQYLVDNFGKFCEQAGAKPGTTEYLQCVVYLADIDAQRRHQAEMQRQQAMGQMGMSLLQMSQPYTLPTPQIQPTRTNCYVVGNQIMCRSF